MEEIFEVAHVELQKLIPSLHIQPIIAEQTLYQFKDYAKKTKYFITQEKLPNILKCAVLIVVKTLKHRGDSQPATFQSVMGETPERLDEVILVLKEWVTFGQILEETRIELKDIIEQFSFMLAISTKFDKVFKLFQFQEQVLQQQQSDQQQAIIETTLYVIAVFQFLLTSVQRFTSGTFLEQNKGKEKQALLKHFNVQDTESYEVAAGQLVKALREILDRGILQHYGEIYQIFSPAKIEENIHNLSSYYSHYIMNEIDEQYFIQEKKIISSNQINFTPFSRQGTLNKHSAPFPSEKYGCCSTSSSIKEQQQQLNEINSNLNQGKFTSQRFLNYENEQTSTTITAQNNQSDIKYASPQTQQQQQVSSPLLTKNTLRGNTTPITNAMEMYNWLHSRKNILSSSSGTIAMELNKKIARLDSWIQENVSKLISFEESESKVQANTTDFKLDHRISEQRKAQISSLFYRILNQHYLQEHLSDEDILKGILVCAAESVYFILNVKNIFFEKLVEFLQINWFNLWKIMDFFMKLDSTMPVSLKAHILNLEAKVVSYYSWKEDSKLLTFVRAYIDDSDKAKELLDDRQEGYAIEKFFRRLFHQCAYSIHQITSQMILSDTISEGVWRIIKHILCNQSELLIGRHIDQLILCSIYVMCKILKTDTQFRQILNKYEELNSHNKSILRELIYDFQITPSKRDTIVEYYNCIYLVNLKKQALVIAKGLSNQYESVQQEVSSSPIKTKNKNAGTQLSQQITLKNPAVAQVVYVSPLKSMLPNEVFKSISKLPSHMTPQTQMLYAYAESPLLKENDRKGENNNNDRPSSANISGNINSKKMLDFDAEIIPKKDSGMNKKVEMQSFKDRATFAKYLKNGMDSIQESQQENQNSNYIANKFMKASDVSSLVKRELIGQKLSMTYDSDQQEVQPLTIQQSQTVSQVPNVTPTLNNWDNSSSAQFFKQFKDQKINPFGQPQTSINQQQFQRINISNNSQPLQQISQQRINSWQNSGNSSRRSPNLQESKKII